MENNVERNVMVDVDLIDPDPNQPRTNRPIEYLRELGGSIQEKGLRNSIHIRPNPDCPGKYLIINGECRWTASWTVGVTEIRCDIYHGYTDDASVFLDQIMDNVVRKDMDPLETLQSFQRALDMGMEVSDLAKAFGKSPELIEKDLPILKLPEQILKEWDKGNIPKAVARKIAEFPNHKRMLKAWERAATARNTDGMLAKIAAYENAIKQINLFDDAVEKALSEEKKAARVAASRLIKAISTFQETPFANGKGKLLIAVNSRKLSEIKIMADEMGKISNKLKADLLSYKTQKKNVAV